MTRVGRRANIIAERVELTGTLRSFDAGVRQKLLRRLEDTCRFVQWQGGDYELTIRQGHPATINDPEMTNLIRETALGLGFQVGQEKPSLVSEDFSLLSRLAPSAYFLVGAKLDDGRPARYAHNAQFDLDERFIPIAAAMFAETARQYLLQAGP